MFWNKQPSRWGPNLFLQHSVWYFNTQYGSPKRQPVQMSYTIIRTPENKANFHNSTVCYMCSMSPKHTLQHATCMNSHFHLAAQQILFITAPTCFAHRTRPSSGIYKLLRRTQHILQLAIQKWYDNYHLWDYLQYMLCVLGLTTIIWWKEYLKWYLLLHKQHIPIQMTDKNSHVYA